MAGNDWINSYLEAIVDSGPKLEGSKPDSSTTPSSSSLLLRERGGFNPTRYFVEEVISGYDETDLYKSWVRTASMRSPQERNTRMENMSWRIWNLARKKKQIEGEELRRSTKRRIELLSGRRDAAADMSEDLSEGEKGDMIGDMSSHGDSLRGGSRMNMPRINSIDALDAWAIHQKEKKLYIVLISLHGLIRGENMELGRDSDTGGQSKYVVELARALGEMPGVYRVDLLTRQISDPDVDWSYGEPTEMLAPRGSGGFSEDLGESSGSYIVRIPFGPKNKYIPKELLWPYVQEFVDGALSHIMQISDVLGEQIGNRGDPVWPCAIHGHYADAGDSASLLAGALNVPMVFTGHSLGRDKLEQLMKQGRQSRDEINSMYKIIRRIEGEEVAIDASEIIITSTRQEIEEQWNLYDGFDVVLERKLRARLKRGVNCFGRSMPRMLVVPPGMEFSNIPKPADFSGDVEGKEDNHPSAPDPPIWPEVMRFFSNPHKPMILALARPDPKKNIMTLVKAFGECRPLRELANLTLIMGNRDNIDEMATTSASVLTSVIKLIDKYDLYGQVAYPKHHKQRDVPEIYRLAAKTKGVFINPAFIEPFGLTLIEAAGYGLPMVATRNGGPVDIHKVLDNGLLVDPHDQKAIADALLKLVADKHLWLRCQQNGLKNIHLFSWPEHCKTYLSRVASCKPRHPQWKRDEDTVENSDEESQGDSLKDISLNLKLSLDGENLADGSLGSEDNPAGIVRSRLESAFLRLSKSMKSSTQKAIPNETTNKYPMLRTRTHIFVIALDCDADSDLVKNMRNIFESVRNYPTAGGSIGFVLSTSLTISEVHSLIIVSGGFNVTDFDAFICNTGSDLYYPCPNLDDVVGGNSSNLPFSVDLDYHSQIEYRWGGEGLRKTLLRWAGNVNAENEQQIVTEDEERSSRYCLSFNVNNIALVPPVKEIRKLMRIQALRCHVISSGNKLHVIPVLASRSQALRYLYVRWGTDLKKMVVFVGESGATDNEGLFAGVPKTVVLKGVGCGNGSNVYKELTSDRSNITQTGKDSTVDEIRSALCRLGVL